MAKKKTSFGTALGFITLVTTRVMAATKECGEEVVLGLSEDKLRELIDQFTEALIKAGNATAGIFAIVCEGLKASELVRRGNYDDGCVDGAITDKFFPIDPHASVSRKIELVGFDYAPTSENVLKEFERRGIECPIVEDALVFGTTYPEEQRKHPVVFLHEPVQVNGNRNVLVLYENDRKRNLNLNLFDNRWNRNYVFAGVRNSLCFSPPLTGGVFVGKLP